MSAPSIPPVVPSPPPMLSSASLSINSDEPASAAAVPISVDATISTSSSSSSSSSTPIAPVRTIPSRTASISSASTPVISGITPLTGRLTLPLTMPSSSSSSSAASAAVGVSDFIRPPLLVSHGLDGITQLCSSVLGHQKKYLTESIQALISRENQIRTTESGLQQIQSTLNETDLLMSQLHDGLTRFDQMLIQVSHQIDNSGRGTWMSLRPAAALLMSAHIRTGELSTFRVGYVAELEKSMVKKELETDASASVSVASSSK